MDLLKLAQAIADAPPAGIRFRQGSIVSVAADDTVTVTIGGSSVQISGIKVASHVCPVPGAACWLVTDGRDWMVMATLAPAGPAYGTMRKSTAQTIATTAFTELNWASRTETAAIGVTLQSNGIKVDVPGLYSVTGTVVFAANSTGMRHARLVKNGNTAYETASAPATNQLHRLPVFGIVNCAIDDVLNIAAYQNSGAGLATDVGAGSCVLTATWIGPTA